MSEFKIDVLKTHPLSFYLTPVFVRLGFDIFFCL